jgi:hypothetical protein
MFNFSETTVRFFLVSIRSTKCTWEAHKNKSKQWTMGRKRNNSCHGICDNADNIITCVSVSQNSLRCKKIQCRQDPGIWLCTWLENVRRRLRTVRLFICWWSYEIFLWNFVSMLIQLILGLVSLVMFVDQYKFWSSSLWTFLHPPFTSNLLGLNVLLNTFDLPFMHYFSNCGSRRPGEGGVAISQELFEM